MKKFLILLLLLITACNSQRPLSEIHGEWTYRDDENYIRFYLNKANNQNSVDMTHFNEAGERHGISGTESNWTYNDQELTIKSSNHLVKEPEIKLKVLNVSKRSVTAQITHIKKDARKIGLEGKIITFKLKRVEIIKIKKKRSGWRWGC